MLKQEIQSINSIYNIIDFLIEKEIKNIFLNFSYYDDDENPSILIGGFGNTMNEEDFNQILLHPDISKRESTKNYPFINSCFNLGKKVSIYGKNNVDIFSVTFENKDLNSPYLNYKKVSKKRDQFEISNTNYVCIKFEMLEEISFREAHNKSHYRRPHIAFYNLLNETKNNLPIRYYKFIGNGYDFSITTKSSSDFINNDFTDTIEPNSPFQEKDPQCQELEETFKSFEGLNLRVKPFLVSFENNTDIEENDKMHGIYFMHKSKIILFDKWENTLIKKKRISAKDPNKIIRIRVLIEGDISFGNMFSINPLTNKIRISNEIIKMIDIQIEESLKVSLSITNNIDEENKLELQNIAKNDALAAYKELVYSKKYNRENAIRKICDEGEMVKYNFIEEYLRGAEV